jgi:hypothetical protein
MSREEGRSKAPSRLLRFQEASMSEAVKETKALVSAAPGG